MGIYVNPGNGAFSEAVNSMIYVDKSRLIDYTNSVMKTQRKHVCVSRPRRFGKSMAADMLVAYYSKGCDSGHLFGRLNVSAKECKTSDEESDEDARRLEIYRAHLNQHNVIRFDVQRFLFDGTHISIFIQRIQDVIIQELKIEFPDCFDSSFEIGQDPYGLPGALERIYARTGSGFVFIVDEWDCVFRLAKEDVETQRRYLDFLRGLFKGSEYVELAYMTGILPIKKYGEHSAINIFDEYSVTDPKTLGEYFGFTEKKCGSNVPNMGWILWKCRNGMMDTSLEIFMFTIRNLLQMR